MYNTGGMDMMDHVTNGGQIDMGSPMARHFFESPQYYGMNTFCHHNHHAHSDNSNSTDLLDEEADDEDEGDLLSDPRSPLSSSALSDQESVRGMRHGRRRRRCPQQQIQQRQAANMRERKRMQSINDAFEGLREHIPILPYEKRLSKVDTLKMAIDYINLLSELIKKDTNGNEPKGPVPEPPKKIVLQAHRGQSPHSKKNLWRNLIGNFEGLVSYLSVGGEFGLVGGHSLSWTSEKGGRYGSIMIAKVWTPENPNNGKILTPGPPFLDENN